MDKAQNRRHLIIVSVLVVITTAIVLWILGNTKLLPVQASAEAVRIDGLFQWHIRAIAFLFSLIMVFVIYSLVVFRRRAGDDGDGVHFHGNTRLEIFWTVIPLIVVLIFGFMGSRALTEITSAKDNELVVEVTGLQFDWWFSYPDYGIERSQELVLPAGRTIHLRITSNDVIHSFWVPEFRVKQDAVPGRWTDLRITPSQPGDYLVRCAELCGTLHYDMRAPVIVVEPDEFDAWVAGETAAIAEAAAGLESLGDAAIRGSELATSAGCVACHNIDGAEGSVGPTWRGLFGSERTFADGSTSVAGENYIHNSILNPNSQVVSGYVGNIMPQTYADQLTEEEITDLIAYIKSLGSE